MVKTVEPAFIGDYEEVCRQFGGEEELSIDLETSGLDPMTSKIAVITLHAPRLGKSAIIHNRGQMPERLRHFLSAPHVRWTHHNGTAFDVILQALAGVDVYAGRHYDTMVGELVTLASGRKDVSVSLKATTQRRLNKSDKRAIDHGGWMNEQLSDEQEAYCLGDIGQLHQLREVQTAKVAGTPQERELELEMDIIPVSVAMTLNGLPMRRTSLAHYTDLMHTERLEAQNWLFERFGQINLRSPIQLKNALRAAGIPVASTNYETMRDLDLRGVEHATVLLKYRHADQRVKMYSDEWVKEHTIADTEGILWIHSRFWQVGTDTGRFSSSNPNLQQVPRDMRWVFEGPLGYKIVSVDYSQLEVRWAAEISKDPALLEAFRAGGDSHRQIASQVFQRAPADITQYMRQVSKDMVFCLLFAGGADTLYHYARRAGSEMTEADARQLVVRFFSTYRGLAAMKDRAVYLARQNRPVTITMPSGLRRVLVGISLRPQVILNTMIQGSAASGIKYGMLEAKKRGLHRRGLGAQVHDELVACVPEAEAPEYAAELRECLLVGMRRAMTTCPIDATAKIGQTWNDDIIPSSRREGS